ncbi:hypothetical protein P7C70_g3670, partial [Phenoliferia sp. Uapishka_3]
MNPTNGLPADGIQNYLRTVQATFTHVITRQQVAIDGNLRLDFFIPQEGENEIEALFSVVKLAGGNDNGLTLDRFARLAGEGLKLNQIYGEFPNLRKGQKGNRNITSLKWDRAEQIVRGVALKSQLDQVEEQARKDSGEADADKAEGGEGVLTEEEEVATLAESELRTRQRCEALDETLLDLPPVLAPTLTPPDQDHSPAFDPHEFLNATLEPDGTPADEAPEETEEIGLAPFIIIAGLMDDPEVLSEHAVIYVDEWDECADARTPSTSSSSNSDPTGLDLHTPPSSPLLPTLVEPTSYKTLSDIFPNSTDAKPLLTRAERRARGPQTGPKRCEVQVDVG